MSPNDVLQPPVVTVPANNDTGIVFKRGRTPKRIRNLELMLLCCAFLVNAAALILVHLGLGKDIPMGMLQLAAIPTAAILALHFLLRLKAPDADPFIVPIATVLSGIGVAMIHRIDLAKGLTGWESNSVRQLVWSAIAIVSAGIVLYLIKNHRTLQRYTYLAMALGVLLLLAPMIPGIGYTVNDATIWVRLGSATMQPGEIAKILLAIFFAGYLVSNKDTLTSMGPKLLGFQLPRLKDLGPILVVWGASVLVLVMQRDLGTSLLYFGLFLVMLYLASGKSSWILIGIILFAAGAIFAYFTISRVEARVEGWIHAFVPEVYNASGGSWQLVQGLFGLAHGGLLGTGLGQGRPNITPLVESDFIYTAIGEELGLTGLFVMLVLYLILISRGLKLGVSVKDDFGKLLAAGLSFTIALQCFIVIGGVTRLIPLTGLTTPFLAAGGSSLVSNWIILALLLRISDTVRNQPVALIVSGGKQ